MNGDDDIRKTQGRGLSQPLTQGPPQSSRSVASKGTRAPSPPPQPGRSRSLSLQELHDILAKLLISLKRKTQLSVLGFKTIAIGLVEGIDENGVAFQTLVYTASGDWGSADLEAQAAALGITRWIVDPRAQGRGASGAPRDAEQLMIEGQDQADMTLLGMAVSRKPCLDCAEAIRDEDVETVFVDPSKHIPKRQRAERSGSAAKQTALAEIDQAFMRQAVTPGQEATTGLEPKSSLWPALNVLNMEELYQVLLKAERDGRLKTIQSKVGRAQGVNNNRLLAPMDAIQLKRENLRANPDALTQAVVAGLLMERLALLPPDQSQYILKQLYPVLRLRTPLKSVPPKRQQQKESSRPKEPTPSEKAKESSSFVGPMMKALIAIGATAAALDALADFLLALAVDFFTKVILRIVAKGAEKAEVRKMVDEVVDKAVKEAGPKLRVLGEEVRYRVPEVLKEELNHIAEEVTRPRLAR